MGNRDTHALVHECEKFKTAETRYTRTPGAPVAAVWVVLKNTVRTGNTKTSRRTGNRMSMSIGHLGLWRNGWQWRIRPFKAWRSQRSGKIQRNPRGQLKHTPSRSHIHCPIYPQVLRDHTRARADSLRLIHAPVAPDAPYAVSEDDLDETAGLQQLGSLLVGMPGLV